MNDFVVIAAGDARKQQFDWGALHWYAGGAMGNAAEITVGKCVLDPGCKNPSHLHTNCEEVLHVLSGEILHHVRGHESVAMGPGDTITIRAGVSHCAENTGDGPAELLIAFSSARRETQGE